VVWGWRSAEELVRVPSVSMGWGIFWNSELGRRWEGKVSGFGNRALGGDLWTGCVYGEHDEWV
jgi:hypothetical protein